MFRQQNHLISSQNQSNYRQSSQNQSKYRQPSQINTNQRGENSQNYFPQYDNLYHESPSENANLSYRQLDPNYGFSQYQEDSSPNNDVDDDGGEYEEGDDGDGDGVGQYHEDDDSDGFDDFVQPTQSFSQLLSANQSQQQPQIQPAQSQNLFIPATSSCGKRVWDHVEDELLISAFMNTSLDKVSGTSQKKNAFWGRVWEAFEAGRISNPTEIAPRNADMVKGHWSRLAPRILRWAAFYDEDLARKKSGQNDNLYYISQGRSDVLREAHLLHNRKNGRFILKHAWNLLRKFRKWRSIVIKSMETPRGRPKNPQENVDSPRSGSSGKRTRVDRSDSMPETPTTGEGGEVDPRPYGVKKAKSKLKGGSSQTVECSDTVNERLRIHSERKSVDVQKDKTESRRFKQGRLLQRNKK
ncbi:uncharacterized protein LOC104906516 [Beta vulgaris subsp. vulgaris]|uniref:uncharacterized protein LOC104906516 n=1 Tax=Beta vulgaris subsp. vulgaris TaxID=3555 RepID=UPI002036D1C4|nr:uncharacterized protein LOC104906516 [Beta vulgaris subsp. vulgaris]